MGARGRSDASRPRIKLTVRVLATLRSLWFTLVRRRRAEQSLDEEVRQYVDLLTAEYVAAGLASDRARRRALIETGGVEQVMEATRDAWVGQGIATFVRECRFALRSLRSSRAFCFVAVTILAIGIGGATAIFTVINGSILQPLPAVSEPGELVSLEPVKGGRLLYNFSYHEYRNLREQTRSLAGLAGYDGTSRTLEDRSGPRHSAWVSYVTGDFFSVLGVRPAAGRLIHAADEAFANPVVVLAYDVWQERYDGDPAVIGSTVHLSGRPLTVIGVAPPRFIGAILMHPMDLWIPVTIMPALMDEPGMLDDATGRYLRLVGRLMPGVTVDDAQHELSPIADRLAGAYPVNEGRGIRVFAGAGLTRAERSALARVPLLLGVAVALLLLIACANVASLSLVRATTRRRELATCLALGASRRSVFGRLLLEGAVLAAIGALLGVGLARALVRSQAIVGTIAGMPERVGLDSALDARVLLVALGVTAFTAVVVTLAPALHVMRLAPGSVLKDGGIGAGRRRSVGQRALVVGQIAASFVLLVSAAIVLNTFRRVLATDPGFDAQGLAVVSPDFSEAGLDSGQVIAYRQEWRRRAAENPSISGVALASVVPPAPWTRDGWVFRGGQEPPPGIGAGDSPADGVRAYLDIVSPDFFDVMQIPMQAGRGFLLSDDVGAEPVVIVSRSLAAALWPNVSPLGRMFSLPPADGQRRPPMRVIGVAGDVRFASIFDKAPHVAYMPTAQHPDVPVSFIVRSRNSATLPDATVRAIGTATDASVSMHTTVIGERINSQVEPQRVGSAWIGVFGMVALLLAAVGLYGVVAQGVLQRKRELAVRSALGSTPGGLVSLVIGEGALITLVGAVIGVMIGGAALRVLQSQFAGVSVMDAQSAVVATMVTLALATIVACVLPARKAGRLNPVDVLRSD